MKACKKLFTVAVTLLFVSLFSACSMYSYTSPNYQTTYDNPQWAPPYYTGARYYYLPDVESYYDLSTHNFIFLNNGQWVSSSYLPSQYGGFDLNNCFAVVLNVNVYEPWMHHQYYISHYPRYYYRDYYDYSNFAYVRGFNENIKSAIYWSDNERDRARNWDNRNVISNRQFQYTKEDRQQQSNRNNIAVRPSPDNNNNKNTSNNQNNQYNQNSGSVRPSPDNNNNKNSQNNKNNQNSGTARPTPVTNNSNDTRTNQNNNTNATRNSSDVNITRQPQDANKTGNQLNTGVTRQEPTTPSTTQGAVRSAQNTNYYGPTIGQPVKVEKQMREPSATTNSSTSRGESVPNNQGRR